MCLNAANSTSVDDIVPVMDLQINRTRVIPMATPNTFAISLNKANLSADTGAPEKYEDARLKSIIAAKPQANAVTGKYTVKKDGFMTGRASVIPTSHPSAVDVPMAMRNTRVPKALLALETVEHGEPPEG
jgi:hypothetical protein